MLELAYDLAASEADRLEQAEALVRGFCGWHIAPSRSETVTVDGSGGQILHVPTLHLTAVTSVVEDGTTVDLADLGVYPGGYIYRAAGWCGKRRAVVVTMTHGWDAAPAEVTGVVQAVAQRAVSNPKSQVNPSVGPFRDSNSATGSAESAALALLPSEKHLLARYRLS